MILVPGPGEPGAGVGVAAEGEVETMTVEGAAAEVGRIGAWREGVVVVVADDAMVERLYGVGVGGVLCDEEILDNWANTTKGVSGVQSD